MSHFPVDAVAASRWRSTSYFTRCWKVARRRRPSGRSRRCWLTSRCLTRETTRLRTSQVKHSFFAFKAIIDSVAMSSALHFPSNTSHRWNAEEAVSCHGICWRVKGCHFRRAHVRSGPIFQEVHLGPAAEIQSRWVSGREHSNDDSPSPVEDDVKYVCSLLSVFWTLVQVGQWFSPLITWMKPTFWATASPSSPKGSCTAAVRRFSWRTVSESASTWRSSVGWGTWGRRRWERSRVDACWTAEVLTLWSCFWQNDCDCASDCSCACSICTAYKDQSQNQSLHPDRVLDGKTSLDMHVHMQAFCPVFKGSWRIQKYMTDSQIEPEDIQWWEHSWRTYLIVSNSKAKPVIVEKKSAKVAWWLCGDHFEF